MENEYDKDYYKVLGVVRTASKEEIRKSYRKLAIKFHPDKGGSEEIMKSINEAYNILYDDEKRKEYDIWYEDTYYPKPKSQEFNEFEDYVEEDDNYEEHNGFYFDLTEELVNKAKEFHKESKFFDVTIFNTDRIILPNFCSCCSNTENLKEYIATYTEVIYEQDFVHKLSFPFCEDCLEHYLKFKKIELLKICLSIFIFLILYGLCLIFLPNFKLMYSLILSIIFGTLIYFITNLFFKLKPLDDMHGSIEKPVEFVYVGNDKCIIRCWNYIYAVALEQINEAELKIKNNVLNMDNKKGNFNFINFLRNVRYVLLVNLCLAYFLYNVYYNFILRFY